MAPWALTLRVKLNYIRQNSGFTLVGLSSGGKWLYLLDSAEVLGKCRYFIDCACRITLQILLATGKMILYNIQRRIGNNFFSKGQYV